MMPRIAAVTALALGLLTVLSSCMFDLLEKEKDKDRVVLRTGKQVPEALVGYVAVPNTPPKEVTNNAKVTYAILAAHDLVPEKMSGYLAMSPGVFKNLTGTTVEPPAAKAVEPWVLKYGKQVPAEMEGWIGVKPSQPKVERKGENAMAELAADQIIPKEMNGWIAMDRTVLAKLASDKTMEGVNIREKK